MATEYLDFEGTIAWAKVYEPDNAFGAMNWKLDLYPKDDAELERIKKAGIQKTVKENLDPEKGPVGKYIGFTRAANKVIKGAVVNFTGPIIYNDEGKVVVDYINSETEKRVSGYSNEERSKVVRRGNPILIGNGSQVRVRVAIYDTQKGKGQRIESVTILDLVKFEKGDRPLPEVLDDIRSPIGNFDQKNSSGTISKSDEPPF